MEKDIGRRELWKPIPGFEGYYEASSKGRIRSVARHVEFAGRWGPSGRLKPAVILRPLNHTGGYHKVLLWKAGVTSQHLVHKLILWTFVGVRPDGREACHLNGIKTDNRISNLHWGLRSENQAHREAHGTGRIGKRFSQKRVSDHIVHRIRTLAKVLNKTEIARALQLPRTTVNDLVNGRTRTR